MSWKEVKRCNILDDEVDLVPWPLNSTYLFAGFHLGVSPWGGSSLIAWPMRGGGCGRGPFGDRPQVVTPVVTSLVPRLQVREEGLGTRLCSHQRE